MGSAEYPACRPARSQPRWSSWRRALRQPSSSGICCEVRCEVHLAHRHPVCTRPDIRLRAPGFRDVQSCESAELPRCRGHPHGNMGSQPGIRDDGRRRNCVRRLSVRAAATASNLRRQISPADNDRTQFPHHRRAGDFRRWLGNSQAFVPAPLSWRSATARLHRSCLRSRCFAAWSSPARLRTGRRRPASQHQRNPENENN